jgi:hypothetical protein
MSVQTEITKYPNFEHLEAEGECNWNLELIKLIKETALQLKVEKI